MENSKIEWTDHTANFWWGCVKVSPGCQHCYAETLSNRWGKSIWGPASTTDREYKKAAWVNVPKWDKQAAKDGVRYRVFVQSMADFFEDHPQVVEWRRDALHLMAQCKGLDFQILTKRPENIARMIEIGTGRSAEAWCNDNKHCWLGTSVENQETADKRIPELLKVPAAVRFLSMEPLLGPVSLDRCFGLLPGNQWAECLCGEIDPSDRPCLTCEARQALGTESGIHWVIAGGESGPHARPMHPDWVRSIRDQCQAAGVPFHFKQWGEWIAVGQTTEERSHEWVPVHSWGDGQYSARIGKKAAGRLLDGVEHNGYPTG